MPQQRFFGLAKTISAVFFILLISLPLSASSSDPEKRSDLIPIQLPDDVTVRQMPAAMFLHDRHTKALEGKDCTACHLTQKNQLVFKFKRLRNEGLEADKTLYHQQCTACHEEKKKQDQASGPLLSECRVCHDRNSPYQTDLQPFGFDKSLHFRHEMSAGIPSPQGEKDWNCGACHHEYDKDRQKTVYVKGQEGTCRYCHKQTPTDEARSFQTVAHESCVNCHVRLKALDQKAGPIECAGCHDASKQSQIATLEAVPRMRRNQPDSILLSLWMKEAMGTGKPARQFMNPVAFNHLSHEAGSPSCHACHHAAMTACGECHTRMGAEKGGFIRLETAMHTEGNMAGCMGCHQKQLKDKTCAGCHSPMPQKSFPERNCADCHSVGMPMSKPLPTDPKTLTAVAETEISARDIPLALVPENDIPENVTIDIMKDQYEGATFPHRKILRALSSGAQKSRLARHFHKTEETLCTGCHHNSPNSLTPPKCAACHGVSDAPDPDGRPGLKGAYHGQCIRCHQEMGITKPAATDCAACHKPSPEASRKSGVVGMKEGAP